MIDQTFWPVIAASTADMNLSALAPLMHNREPLPHFDIYLRSKAAHS